MSGDRSSPARRDALALCAALSLVLALLVGLSALPARACTEDTVLETVRRIEAAGSYDTVYYGVRLAPPRPVTTMTVGEVLDWQRSTVRQGSVSSAAGAYQIIRPTLQGLVDQGVVSRAARFDRTTQDRLGRHLLRQTGYRAGDTSSATANRIAGVWAALPRLSGPGAGRSAYEGVAGNHALIGGDSFRALLACRISPDALGSELATIRTGERFGFAWDRFLEDTVQAATRVMGATARAASGLLLALFVVDLVLRGGRWIVSGDLRGTMGGFSLRLLTVCLCLAVLGAPEVLIGTVDIIARDLAGSGGQAGAFSLAGFAVGHSALVFSLLEGIFSLPVEIQVFIQILVLLITGVVAVQFALIIYWSLNLLFAGAVGVVVLGLGGLKETTHAVWTWLRHLIGAAFALFCVLVITTLFIELGWTARAAVSLPAAALGILLIETVACVLLWVLPRSLTRLAKG